MKYIECATAGGPEVLRLVDGDLPRRKSNEVLIQVAAAGVNRPDISGRQGKYPPPPGASPILGLEVAGTIVEADPSSKWKVGDKVCALTPGGGYAQYCVAPSAHCLPIPQHLSFEQSAGIPETFFTVWANVFMTARLKSGENFLVHGGTSGIGTTAIQLAKAFGAKVYTTAGSARKCQACLDLGADGAVNYKEKEFVTEINRWTNQQGVHVVLDMVGGSYTNNNLDCMAPLGRLVQIATMQGADVQVNLLKIMQKRLTLTGSTLRPRSAEEKAEIAQELLEFVWPLFADRNVKVLVDRVFPMAEVQDAHRYMESSQHIGKIILKMS